MDRKDIYILFLNSSELSNSIALLPAVIIPYIFTIFILFEFVYK